MKKRFLLSFLICCGVAGDAFAQYGIASLTIDAGGGTSAGGAYSP